MTRARAADLLYGASLVTLPWIGLDPVRLVSGVDVGAGFQPSYLLLAGAIALVAVPAGPQAWRAGWREARPWGTLALLAGAAVGWSALGLAIAPPAAGPVLGPRALRLGKQAIQLGVMLAFAAYPLLCTRGAGRWERTRRLCALALGVQVAYGLAQAAAFGHAPVVFRALERVFTSNPAILSGSEELYLGRGFTGIPRLRGTACEPLYLGNYLLVAVPVLLLPGARRRDLALAAAGGVLLLMTWSRGAWLAAAVAVVTWLVLRRGRDGPPAPGRSRRRPAAALLAGGLLLGAGLVLLWRPDVALLPVRRLAQSVNREDWSNLTRLYSAQAAWRAFLLSPVVGIGWGQFGFHFAALVDPLGLQSQFSWPVVNNFPLEILCETGALGFAAFVVGTSLVVRQVRRSLARGAAADRAARGRVAVLAAATAGAWCQTLTFSQYNLPHLWVALGLLIAAVREEGGAGG